jgi:hypothetical protein
MLVGFWIAGKIVDQNLIADGSHSWQDIWIFPAVFAIAVMIIFALLFKNEKVEYKA